MTRAIRYWISCILFENCTSSFLIVYDVEFPSKVSHSLMVKNQSCIYEIIVAVYLDVLYDMSSFADSQLSFKIVLFKIVTTTHSV